MAKRRLIAEGRFMRQFGGQEHPYAVGFEIKDTEGKFFQTEEVLLCTTLGRHNDFRPLNKK